MRSTPVTPGLAGRLLGVSLPAIALLRIVLPGIALLRIVLSGVALLGIGACSGPPDGPPGNLLIVTVDTLRADRLGTYGYEHIETPNFDRLAREGVRFERALTPVPLTLPAHATLFTGTTPPQHGIRENGTSRLAPSASTLAERFRDAGYATGAFVGAFVLDPRYGLSQGFDTFTGPGVAAGTIPAEHSASERRGDEVLEDALGWIDGRDSWFAWVHLFDPHAGYAPPEPWASRYVDRPYDGEVAWVDSLLGRLRAALEESGQWADTTVIVTSDHGEALGDHGEPTHGFFLYEPTLRVPLIVRPADGDGAALERGIEVPTTVGLVDLVPTVIELWGLEPTGREEDPAGRLAGRSLVPALRGEPIEPVALYAETVLPRTQYGWAGLKAIVVGPDKYILAPRPELYDVEDDPGEVRNLVVERPRRAADLKRRLEDRLTRLEAAASTAGPGAKDAGAAGAGSQDMDPDALARLRSLGYLGGGGAPAGATSTDRPDPKDRIDTYNTLVEILGVWRDGDADEALERLDTELDRAPDSAGAWYYRGLVLSDLGRLEEAAVAFSRAWELDPGHVVAARWLARTHRQSGDVAAAVAVLEELLRDDPLDRQLRWDVARFHLRAGDIAAAERVLREGLEMAPGAPSMLLGMGRVELQRDGPGEALEFLDRAATLAPQLDDVHYYRGRALRRLDRADEALEAYAVELARQPLHFGALLDRAVLLAARGHHSEAVESLRAALRARPESLQVRLFLAQTLLASVDSRVGAGGGGGASGRDPGTPAEAVEEARRLATEVAQAAEDPELRRRAEATLAQITGRLGSGGQEGSR